MNRIGTMSVFALVLLIGAAHGQPTRLVKDINPGSGSTILDKFTEFDGRLIFEASVVHEFSQVTAGIWRSDGTDAGTYPLLTLPGGYVDRLLSTPAGVFFTASSAGPAELWHSDGTPAFTRRIKVLGGGFLAGSLLAYANGTLFFTVNDGQYGFELWKSDGTEAGTILLADLNPGPGPSNPGASVVVGSAVYFTAYDGAGLDVWRTDGTLEGTVRVSDTRSTTFQPRWLTAVGNDVFFVAQDAAFGAELWTSDGTPSGTRRVADLFPGPTGSSPDWLISADGSLYFFAEDDARGYGLWKLGAGETVPIPLGPPLRRTCAAWPVDLNGAVLFAADEQTDRCNTTGCELWTSDGTGEGTRLVRDIESGGAGSGPSPLAVLGEQAYFGATDTEAGRALWRSDGTGGGTTRIADPNPDGAEATITDVQRAGSLLFFAASSPAAGLELWVHDPSQPDPQWTPTPTPSPPLPEFDLSGAWTIDGDLIPVVERQFLQTGTMLADETGSTGCVNQRTRVFHLQSPPFCGEFGICCTGTELTGIVGADGVSFIGSATGCSLTPRLQCFCIPFDVVGARNDVPPSATSTETPAFSPTGSLTATPTPSDSTVPTATETATIPPPACPGDCDSDRRVTVDELVTGVRIALGSEALSACVAFDVDEDGEVTIDELVRAVQAALGGCDVDDGGVRSPPVSQPEPAQEADEASRRARGRWRDGHADRDAVAP